MSTKNIQDHDDRDTALLSIAGPDYPCLGSMTLHDVGASRNNSQATKKTETKSPKQRPTKGAFTPDAAPQRNATQRIQCEHSAYLMC